MYMSNLKKFLTFSMWKNQLVHQKSTNQPKTNKMPAEFNGQLTMYTQFLMQIMEMQ